MNRADATLVAIVRNIAATGTRWLFWPADVAPRGCYGRAVTIDTVQRHMRRSGYAVPARDGWMELTPAGLDAVEAVGAAGTTADAAREYAARAAGRRGQGAAQGTGEGT